MATLTFPVRPQSSRAEQELISYLEGLRQESRIAKETTDLQDADAQLDAVRGTQAPTPRGYPAFSLNLLADQVQRKVGLYTDARPILEVVSGNPTNKPRCELLTKCLMALWDETTWQEQLARGLALGLQLGCNVGMMAWDPLADHGRGDLRPRFYDPRAVWIDPAVTAATQLEQAEFVCTEEVRAIGSLIEQFGPRAESVRPDGAVSMYPERPARERGLISPGLQGPWRRRSRGQRTTAGQVPRAYCRHYYFKDWPRGADGKPQRYTRVGRDAQGQPILKSTRRQIRHVVVAGGAVLVDEPNPYWHGMYPIEVLDWGVETDHLWGTSEVKQLRSAQSAIERLASQMLRNATLMNNLKVVADMNALDPDQWDALTNRPAIILRKRPNTNLEFQSPPSLPPYLFTLMQFLVQAMDLISGLNDATKGSGSPSQSGVAVECVDEQTECLTMEGWKTVDQLDAARDMLYTLNTETGCGEWSPLLKLNVQRDYVGPMWEVKGKGLDALVTPNHEWVTTTYRHPEQYEKRTTDQLTGGHRIPMRVPIAEDAVATVYTDAYVELVGWLVTEGHLGTHITTKRTGQRYEYPSVRLYQSPEKNPENCERITSCLEQLGIPYSLYHDPRTGVRRWTLGLGIARRLHAEFPDKRPGLGFIYSLTRKQLSLLAEVMLRGDGRAFAFDRPSTTQSISYFSSDKVLAEQFQMIATLAGWGTSLKQEARSTTPGLYRGTHKDPRYGECWRVVCRSRGTISVNSLLDAGKVRQIPYQGLVWCPTTTKGNWLARRNGLTYITSNSLQIAAQTVIRLQARRIEGWLERLFQKAIACIYQYYTGERVLRIYGPGMELQTFLFDRAVLTFGLDGAQIQEAFRDYDMNVRPGSSLNATKVQRGVLAGNLYQMQLIPGVDVLKQVDWAYPDETIQEARQDQIARTQLAMAIQGMGAAQQPQGGLQRAASGQSASRTPASFPASGG